MELGGTLIVTADHGNCEEMLDDDLTVKKVDLDNLVNKDVIAPTKIKVSVISYQKEEAFLEALKQLQQKLN